MLSRDALCFQSSGLERAAELRSDPAKIAALLAKGQVLPIWQGKPLVLEGRALGWLDAGHPVLAHGAAPDLCAAPMFLGLDDDTPRFAQDISVWAPETGTETDAQHHPGLAETYAFMDLRGVMAQLSPRDGECVATAKAVLNWHRSHRFCAACGAQSEPINAGWQRHCPACSAQHFPRTDPVVIMLVQQGDRLLVGRSPGWPEGMYSCLAGFIEPGETIEAAVRREVFEETGITTGDVRYITSQPWPFPTNLMLGFIADATSTQITLDPKELEAALWLSREEMSQVMASAHPGIRPLRSGSIAYHLIENWLAGRIQ